MPPETPRPLPPPRASAPGANPGVRPWSSHGPRLGPGAADRGIQVMYALLGVVTVVLSGWMPLFVAVAVVQAAQTSHLWVALGVAFLQWTVVVPAAARTKWADDAVERWILRARAMKAYERQALTPVLDDVAARAGEDAERLKVVVVDLAVPNAMAFGGSRIAVTTAALDSGLDLHGIVAHEVGHIRLNHLDVRAWAYLYTYPLLLGTHWAATQARAHDNDHTQLNAAALHAVLSVLALPTALAVVLLRCVDRLAERRADGFAAALGYGVSLAELLRRIEAVTEEQRSRFGFVPLPGDHPRTDVRLARLRAAPNPGSPHR